MSKNTSENKRIAKNTVFLYIRMLFVMLVSLYTTRVVLRVLGVEDYGVYNVVCGFVSMFGLFNTCLTTGTNRFYNFALGKSDNEELRNTYKASLLIQIALIIAVLFLIESFGLWYLNNKLVIPESRVSAANSIFQYSVISLVLLLLTTPYSAAVMAYEKMNFYAIVSIIDAVLKLVFVVLLQFITYDKLLFYGLLMMIISAFNFLLNFIYCRLKFKELRLSGGFDKLLFKNLFSFSTWSLIDPFTYTVKGQGSNLVLNAFFGTIVNAAYGVATQVSTAVDSFTNNLSIAFRPQIIKSYAAGDYTRTRKLMFAMSKINFMLHSMLVIPVLLEIKYLLSLWLGDGYPVYTPIFAQLVMIIQTFNCLHSPISTVMVATGEIKKIKIVSAIIICSVIPLSVVGFKLNLPPFSIFLILLFLTIVNVLVSGKIMSQAFPTIAFGDYIKKIIIPCVEFIVLVTIIPMISWLVLPESILRVFIISLLSLICTMVIGYYIICDKNERELFSKILPIKKLKK